MTPSLDEALANCSAEPIHIPGAIQPFGILFALQGDASTVSELRVAQHSENVREFMEAGTTLVGRRIGELMQLDGFGALPPADIGSGEPVGLVTRAAGRDYRWRAFLHRHMGQAILELELEHEEQTGAVGVLAAVLRDGLARIEAARSVTELCQRACETIKTLAGLEGVMAYRFHRDEHGEVIAEAKNPEFPQYLGLHYPASDIPRQARALFLDNWVRMIPDRDYRPVPMIAAENAEPVDLGGAMLRSVSPVHLEYLRNMGVRASLTLSIISEGKLWGLFAGHHYSGPRHVGFEARAACETVARVASLLLPVKLALEQESSRERTQRVHDQLVSQMRESAEIAAGLVSGSTTLQDLVDCHGAAVLSDDGRWLTVGDAPSPDQLVELAEWIEAHRVEAELFHTDGLARDYAAAAELSDVASGVLAARVPKGRANYVLWFKPEVVQTVRWAGDPHKPVHGEGAAAKLHPRQSFDEWRQAVRRQSTPWTSVDIDAAIELNHAIAAIDLQRQFAREQEARARAEWVSEQKEQLLAMVSHDLRDPLHSLKLNIALLQRGLTAESAAKKALVLDGMERSLERMSRLINDLLSISRLEYGTVQLELGTHQVADLLHDAHQLLVPIAQEKGVRLETGPAEGSVRCDRDRILQVLSNLVSNGVKFTPGGGRVELWAEITPRETRFVVTDTGPGIPSEHLDFVFDRFWQARHSQRLGTGLGLAIAKSIVEAHGGRIWVESALDEGSTFRFALPAGSQVPDAA